MDVKAIKDLVRFIEKTSLGEFEYESETERIYINRQSHDSPEVKYVNVEKPSEEAYTKENGADSQTEVAEEKAEGEAIKTPIVGTFYEAPNPGAEPFVKEGDSVKKGQTLCIIEAMKIMNEIEAEFDCKILKILGVNGEPVEYGETIFLVEKI